MTRMGRATVAVNAQGRITLPAATRRELGLSAGAQLEVRVEEREIRLRPARVVVAEDAWAFTADSLASIRRSLDDIAAGRIFEMTTEQLEQGARPTRQRSQRKR
jgi:AbrB family looped-hinge helix DNA binding protein